MLGLEALKNLPDGEEVANTDVNQAVYTSSTKALDSSSTHQHGRIDAHCTDDASNQKNCVCHEKNGLSTEHISQCAPEGYGGGVGEKVS